MANALDILGAVNGDAPYIAAYGDTDANVNVELRPKGAGWAVQRNDVVAGTNGSLAFNKQVNMITADSNQTMTAAQFRAGIIERSGMTAGRSDTTPTAALLVADIPDAVVGTSYEVVICNRNGTAQTLTILAGAGVTLVPATVTAAQDKNLRLLVTFTNVTAASEAVKILVLSGA